MKTTCLILSKHVGQIADNSYLINFVEIVFLLSLTLTTPLWEYGLLVFN